MIVRIDDPLSRRIKYLFRSVLPPGAKIKVTRLDDVDHMVEVAGNRLRVRSVGRGDLRSVRLAIKSRPKPDVIVASRLSEAAQETIAEAGINWADESGAAEITTDSIVVARSRSGQRHVPRQSPSGWTAAAIGTAEAILDGTNPTAGAIAKATGYSLSTGVRTLAFLTELGLLEASTARGPRSGRRVVDQDRLLEEFAEAAHQVPPKFEIRCGVLWREPFVELERIGDKWNAARISWAAAGALSASIQAPYLTQVPSGVVYVDATGELGLLHIARQAGLEPMDGGRLLLRPFPTWATKRLSTEQDGIWVTSWPRTYADLRYEGVRGEEAAEHLREVIHDR